MDSIGLPAGTFLRRVQIRNYKSLGSCDVVLSPLTVLVGRNGAGKSNFLDALRFVTDGLETSLDFAFKTRGGIDEVRRRSTGHPRNFAIALWFVLPDLSQCKYAFEIAARRAGFAVKHETISILDRLGATVAHYTRSDKGPAISNLQAMPPVGEDRLYLVNASGRPEFRPAYDALVSMGFYNLNPKSMKELQSPDAGELLHPDGSNFASVIGRLSESEPETMARIGEYLATIVPGITAVQRVQLGPRETLQFSQRVLGANHPWKFFASSMSDGTLRALGALVAVMQLARSVKRVSLVGIEEPETALHPAAAGALVDALREASRRTQILVTSHSPDLLDHIDPEMDGLLAVESRDGTTVVAPAETASVEAIRGHLYTAGELLRMDQLRPDEDALSRQEQIELFPAEQEG